MVADQILFEGFVHGKAKLALQTLANEF